MSDGHDDGLWPPWARYAVLGGLALVLAVCVVVMISSGGVDKTALRIVLAAVVIPLVLAPVRLLGLLKRSDRGTGRLDSQLAGLAGGISAERSKSASQRPTGASDEALDAAASWVDSTRGQLAGGARADAARSIEQLERSTSGWARDAPLTREVAECARTAQSLSKTVRRAEKAARRAG